ncbi:MULTISPECIES: phospholipase A [Marinomonas]|uniref:Phospholipase A1 n=1 Tax=Marinomonas arctica TaxID=383750 RepID=A0A7H1J325_9GAMM|nr:MULTISPECIES: phospholipase A [Marinomonas]MCS7485865.1 phospholipase [Marinomonas sp. BSi20414]QNT04891.1 phospholipase A [Marinomonas arctica]GGN17741.1 phospholipase [Marinomonas arctica]
MKAIVCSMMLLPSLLWAQVEPQFSENPPVIQSDGSVSETPTEEEAPYSPEEPAVPDSISQRAREANGLFQQRENRETATLNNPFVLTPHRPNYFLPFSYTSNPNDRSFLGEDTDESLESVEFKFQLSVKFPVVYDVVGRNTSLWFAYTQQAYWQAYNSHISAPFRDTNHEPEVFIVTKPKQGLLGIKPSYITYGFNHQSNGQSGDLSRSWNRFYVDFLFETEDTAFSIKPWYRMPESADIDDNPNIENYYGYGELNIIHVIDDYSIDVMLRNNLKSSDNRGALQVGFTFPLWGKSRGYIQYFNGYGQSLLDYNHQTQSIGVGIMLTNWL